MSAKLPHEREHDCEPGTLGDLLYADRAASPAPEADWVALVRSIAAGDQIAFKALYDRTHHLVFTLLVRLTDDRTIAEELAVDVFHHIWSRASEYDVDDGSVLGWVMQQARAKAIDRLQFGESKG